MKTENQNWVDAGYPLSMEKELLKVRDDIEQNKRHKDEQKTLVIAAHNEIRKYMGKSPVQMNCGNCSNEANRVLRIWLKKYDERTKSQQHAAKRSVEKSEVGILPDEAAKGVEDNGSLIPVDDRREQLEKLGYWELVKLFEKLPKSAQDHVYDTMAGKKPKKTELIDALLKQ